MSDALRVKAGRSLHAVGDCGIDSLGEVRLLLPRRTIAGCGDTDEALILGASRMSVLSDKS